MFDRWLKLPAHHYLYITGLSLIAVGLPLNRVVLSIGCIWIVANWILELDFSTKLRKLKTSYLIYPIYFLLLFHIVGLFLSDDWSYAFKDLIIKLPFFSLPLVVASSPRLKSKYVKGLLSIFTAIVVLTTLINYGNYFGFFKGETLKGAVREMSIFISHIRLSWMIVLSICIGFYFILKNWINRWFWVVVTLWLIIYLYNSQSFTGYVFMLIALVTTLIYIMFYQKKLWIRLLFFAFLTGFIVYGSYETYSIIDQKNHVSDVQLDTLEKYSAKGNKYFHDASIGLTENGNHVFIYYAKEEMKRAWNKKSNINANGLDANGDSIKYTLARYMTSKGLKKDSAGVSKLKKNDIENIENGMPNYKFATEGVFYRSASAIHKTLYQKEADPNGSSLLQRIEHYQAALFIIQNNFWLGIGNGDVKEVFAKAYRKRDSKLKESYRHRAHNQYLTFWISFGIFGFLVFLIFIVAPFYQVIQNGEYLPLIFFVMLFFISASEDVLETQVGVAFSSFFYAIFLFKNKFQEQ